MSKIPLHVFFHNDHAFEYMMPFWADVGRWWGGGGDGVKRGTIFLGQSIDSKHKYVFGFLKALWAHGAGHTPTTNSEEYPLPPPGT